MKVRGYLRIIVGVILCLIKNSSVSANFKCSGFSEITTKSSAATFYFKDASKITKQPSIISGNSTINGSLTLDGNMSMQNSPQIQFNYYKTNGNGNTIYLDSDFTVPANLAWHISGTMVIDGNNHNLILGENSQLFVDDNLTLTLKNVTVKSTKNGQGNPPIKLASNRSQIALDNVSFDLANDFYFDYGKMFAYNDVNFTGTNSFIYRSTMPSYIKSGASLNFNVGTSFEFRPSTTTSIMGLPAKDLFVMEDADSKITFNGATLKTTYTGMRLTKGQIILDNNSSMTNASVMLLPATSPVLTTSVWAGGGGVARWTPDGKYLLISTGWAAANLLAYRFAGTSLVKIYQGTSVTFGGYLDVSSDGKFIAIASTGYGVAVYSWNGSQFQYIDQKTTHGASFTYEPRWSPDGKYVVVPGQGGAEIYSFDGVRLQYITKASAVQRIRSVAWHPSGKYILTADDNDNYLRIYSFDGYSLTLVASKLPNLGGYTAGGLYWRPDGRFFSSTSNNGYGSVLYWDGGANISTPVLGPGAAYYGESRWSADGRYVAYTSAVGNFVDCWEWDSANPMTAGNYLFRLNNGAAGNYISWHPSGNYLAFTGGSTNSTVAVYALNYVRTTRTAAVANTIVFGNSASGSTSDVNLKLLSGANVQVDGTLNYDNVLGGTVFSNDNARFVLKDSNSKIRLNPNTVIGWRDRSLIKNITGGGLGDYNLLNYDTTPPTKIVGYAEAPGELVYDNSNAIVGLARTQRTNSNAFAYGIKNNSNAIVNLGRDSRNNSNAIIKLSRDSVNNSNAIIRLDRTQRTNSNAFAYGIKNNSNAIISIGGNTLSVNNSNAIVTWVKQTSNSTVSLDRRVRYNSNAIKFESDHFISVNNGKVTALGSISGTTNVAGRGILNSPIDLQGGTLTLNSDMILSNLTTVASSGNFDLQGNSIIFGGDLALPTSVVIKVSSSGVIDGQGNEFKNAIGAKLIVDSNVSLTLRNMNWTAAGSPQIEMRASTSRLTLQNLSTKFDRDYSFTQGKLFIQDDVFVTGTSKFSYVSTTTSYIASHSTLYFDKNMTFSYSPRVNKRHTRSERNLIKLLDKTSELYFNECTLQLPDSGWQLTNGAIYFDNKVTTYGNTTQADSFEWGDGSAVGELEIKILSGAWLDNYGYIYHNPAN